MRGSALWGGLSPSITRNKKPKDRESKKSSPFVPRGIRKNGMKIRPHLGNGAKQEEKNVRKAKAGPALTRSRYHKGRAGPCQDKT